jgi:hypothetical protein
MSISTYTRKAKYIDLKDYCPFSEKNDFVELTEWHNGEGFDVTVSGKFDTKFSLTWGQWESLQVLVNYKESK